MADTVENGPAFDEGVVWTWDELHAALESRGLDMRGVNADYTGGGCATGFIVTDAGEDGEWESYAIGPGWYEKQGGAHFGGAEVYGGLLAGDGGDIERAADLTGKTVDEVADIAVASATKRRKANGWDGFDPWSKED